jgi:hypothetical protein
VSRIECIVEILVQEPEAITEEKERDSTEGKYLQGAILTRNKSKYDEKYSRDNSAGELCKTIPDNIKSDDRKYSIKSIVKIKEQIHRADYTI